MTSPAIFAASATRDSKKRRGTLKMLRERFVPLQILRKLGQIKLLVEHRKTVPGACRDVHWWGNPSREEVNQGDRHHSSQSLLGIGQKHVPVAFQPAFVTYFMWHRVLAIASDSEITEIPRGALVEAPALFLIEGTVKVRYQGHLMTVLAISFMDSARVAATS